MATVKTSYKGSDRVTAGSILFGLTRAGRSVSVKVAKEAIKKAGRKCTNMDNRIYWFGRNVLANHGMEVVYDREKQTLRLQKASKSTKPAKAHKSAKKATAKPRPRKVVEVESDETVEV